MNYFNETQVRNEINHLQEDKYLYFYIGFGIAAGCCIIPVLLNCMVRLLMFSINLFNFRMPGERSSYEMVSLTSHGDEDEETGDDEEEVRLGTNGDSDGYDGTRGRESTGYISRVDHRRATPATTDRGGTLDDFALPTDSDFDKNSSVGSPMRAADDV